MFFITRPSYSGIFRLSSPRLFLKVSTPVLGWMTTVRFITMNARSRGHRKWYRRFKSHQKQWQAMKWHLNDLVLKQKLHLTLPWAKELQQYAEELIFLAKRNDPHHAGLVESMLMSPAAREILYEKLVPRYRDRPFHFTRVVNKWQLRSRDSASMGMIEFVDRPGEFQPAHPVGEARIDYVKSVMEYGNRRERRKLINEATNMGIVPPEADSKKAEIQGISEQVKEIARKLQSGGSAVGVKPSYLMQEMGENDTKQMEKRSKFWQYLNAKRPMSHSDVQQMENRRERRNLRKERRTARNEVITNIKSRKSNSIYGETASDSDSNELGISNNENLQNKGLVTESNMGYEVASSESRKTDEFRHLGLEEETYTSFDGNLDFDMSKSNSKSKGSSDARIQNSIFNLSNTVDDSKSPDASYR